jgi:hypothetical protein
LGNHALSCYDKEFVECIKRLEIDYLAYTSCFHT